MSIDQNLPSLLGELPDFEGALCAQIDPDSWFPNREPSMDKHTNANADFARVCQGCPARQACLDFAMDHDERYGVWGGLTPAQRRKLKRGLTRAAS